MKKYIILILGFILTYIILFSQQQYVANTKHNLSSTTSNSYRASSETEICIFCHTPHSSPKVPLWNRSDPAITYTLYSSSTKNATIGQPDGTSVLCLSCHDGTIALGSVASRTQVISFVSGVTTLPTGNSNLGGANLANDHPISFVYNSALASADGQLVTPPLTAPISLDKNSKIQCTSCHNPHSNVNAKFLHASNQSSALCGYCHVKTNWTSSTHKTSIATWNGTGTNPWQHTTYTTVATNACENCHNPHNATGAVRLLNYSTEETNCLVCHSGTVASSAKNIQTQLSKTGSKHNVAGYNNIHDPTENAIAQTMHVECSDCHNPHATNASTANAPAANGYIKGVRGVNASGTAINPITNQYELCFRCHADSPNKPSSPTPRQIAQNNVRLEFATTNPSFHPIETQSPNATVPSLISPWSRTSKMYCTDCHGSDGTTSPKGPHGSIYPRILKYQYITTDNTSYSVAKYELCFKCHSSTSIMGNNSFKEHNKHINSVRTPCNICHDPHGVQGNSTNQSNLINFNTNVVTPSGSGILRFDDQGSFRGRCYLTCHGENHNPLSY